jgi:predicted nucleotide-binding protein
MARKNSAPPPPPERPRLTKPKAEADDLITKQIRGGEALLESAARASSVEEFSEAQTQWSDYTNELLKHLFTTDAIADEFLGMAFGSWDRDPRVYLRNIADSVRRRLTNLRSIHNRLEFFEDSPSAVGQTKRDSRPPAGSSRDVFVVHGRDEATKQIVARFLEKLKLTPVILHEQPSMGKTILEKLESHSLMGFAIALLTPDDVGALASELSSLKPRARQNVVFETGYFMALLGRSNVCALVGEGVEHPSDMSGLVYISLDSHGAWKLELARELKAAKFDIDMNNAL